MALDSITLFVDTSLSIDTKLLAAVLVLLTAILIFIIFFAIISAPAGRITTGAEGLIGQKAIAQGALNPRGIVLIKGEIWNAIVDSGIIESGEEVIVTKVEGLKLSVEKIINRS